MFKKLYLNNRYFIQYFFIMVIFLISITNNSYAAYLFHNFLVVSNIHKYERNVTVNDDQNKLKVKKCTGEIFYPKMSNDDEYITIHVNDAIEDFVEKYPFCNKGDYSEYSVNYRTTMLESKDYFSVYWSTSKNDEVIRIDSINLKFKNADIVDNNEIFNLLSSRFVPEFVSWSEGYLEDDIDWDGILEKIKSGDMQLYIDDDKWYMAFNPKDKDGKLFIKEVPQHMLKQKHIYK